MEFKIIFWIIVGIIWVITKLRQAMKKKPIPEEADPDTQVPAKTSRPATLSSKPPLKKFTKQEKPVTPPAKSFGSTLEDMMREFGTDSAEKTQVPQPSYEEVNPPVKSYKNENYDSGLVDEETQVLQKLARDKEAVLLSKKHGVVSKDEHFEPYALAQASNSKILAMLKNKEDLKTAVVLGEILQRKF